jgi:hypothetical protein
VRAGPPALQELEEMTQLKELDALYRNASEIEKRTKEALTRQKEIAKIGAGSCLALSRGSHMNDYKTFKLNGKTSDHTAVFNLGSYKTGSTSVDAAIQQLGMRACKVGWGDLGDDDYTMGMAFDPAAIQKFDQCPVAQWDCNDGVDVLRRAPLECDAVGDSPWPFSWPTVMRAFPKAKFILTRQKTCADWVYHVRGLWQAGDGIGELTTCWFEGKHPNFWHKRCLETERVIVLTAQMLKLPLLVLHASGERSHDQMEQLARFLGKKVYNHSYPHVNTPSKHYDNETPPPADAPDENADLWAGDWNGGVPYGISETPKASPPQSETPQSETPQSETTHTSPSYDSPHCESFCDLHEKEWAVKCAWSTNVCNACAACTSPQVYVAYPASNCFNGHGGKEIDGGTGVDVASLDECKARCSSDAQCSCIVHDASRSKCWKRAACDPTHFATFAGGWARFDGFDTYVKAGGAKQ